MQEKNTFFAFFCKKICIIGIFIVPLHPLTENRGRFGRRISDDQLASCKKS